MAHVGISITKQTAFRDSVQEFANVYHYKWTGLNPAPSLAEAIIDRLVVLEKNSFSNISTFVHARMWSAGGTQSQNQMIFEKVLSGTGLNPEGQSMDKERAFLIRWRAGVDSRGRPVYLRKYYHLYGRVGSVAISAGVLDQTTGFTEAQRTAISNHFVPFHPLTDPAFPQPLNLCGPTGRDIDGPREAHKYLEHRQLGDQWRG